MKIKILAVCMVCISLAATSAHSSTNKSSPTYDKVISDFIVSQENSDYKKLNQVLNDDASFKLPRGEKVIVQNKESLVDQMKKDYGAQQNCESKYEVLAKSGAMVIARVDFKYSNCIQHDYLIIEKNDNKDWKITQVCKMIEDVNDQDAVGGETASN